MVKQFGTISLIGMIRDVYIAEVDSDFISDVSTALTPGKYAVIADVDEQWITPVDTRMEPIGGVVFRTVKSEAEAKWRWREAAVRHAELDELKSRACQGTTARPNCGLGSIGCGQGCPRGSRKISSAPSRPLQLCRRTFRGYRRRRSTSRVMPRPQSRRASPAPGLTISASSTHRSHPSRFGRSAVAFGHLLASSSQFACLIRAGGGVALFPLTRWLGFVSPLPHAARSASTAYLIVAGERDKP